MQADEEDVDAFDGDPDRKARGYGRESGHRCGNDRPGGLREEQSSGPEKAGADQQSGD